MCHLSVSLDRLTRVGDAIIRTEGLGKSFGDVHALKGIDLEVPQGTVFGLLGPNGAGKTTAIRILTTLLLPDAGRAEVAGLDVVRDAEALRSRIGLAGQSAAVDENLTGLENLEMVGRLYHLSGSEARRRANEVLERFGLADAGRPAREDLLGRHAAAPRRGREPRGPSRHPVPRRADHRSGPTEPHRPVGAHPRARPRGEDDAPDHPVPRGGRPAHRPDRDDRRRNGDRRGHRGRTEGPDRRRGAGGPRRGHGARPGSPPTP